MQTDDLAAQMVKREKKLISLIISMYHTTRLSETSFEDHIHGKAIVREAFADYRAAALTAQAEEIERLRGGLRRIAEGNLGDASWQANYEKIRDVARAALKAAQEVERG